MKSRPLLRASAAKLCRAAAAGILLAALAPVPLARATAELDRQYALETIGLLRSWDNVDGLFSEYVADAYKEWFSGQSRFRAVDLSKADSVFQSSKLPYNRVIEDPQILSQVARTFRAETLLRTRVLKEGPRYKFTLQWLLSPKMESLAEDTFTLDEPHDGSRFGIGDVRQALKSSLDRLIRKVPFIGTVTGRDNRSVTINLGSGAKLRPGDILVTATLDDVKKHPLLKTVVDWRLTPTGRVEIEEVEDAISFGKVTDEEEGRQIARFQKVTQIIPRPEAKDDSPREDREEERARILAQTPRLGWVAGGVDLGSFSRQFGSTDPTAGRSGSGIYVGAHADGQLWLTREWFAEAGFGFGFSGYSQSATSTAPAPAASTGSATGVDVGSMSLSRLRLALGYTYFTTPDFFGPKGYGKLGFRSTKFGLQTVATESLAPISFRGLTIGIGGELPLRDRYGAVLDLDFGLLTSASETGEVNGAVTGSSDVSFFLGGYWRWAPRMTVRAGFGFSTQSADFSNGSTVTHRLVTIGPSLLYYF